ncbi:MAG: NAD-dependent epimerase/dehydratase family protein [Arenicellales bacterium]
MIAQQFCIIGCGEIGQRVARIGLEHHLGFHAWVKSQASLAQCEAMGLPTQCLDLDKVDEVAYLNFGAKSATILYTVPPPKTGLKDTRLNYFLKNLEPDAINKFVLISTTGVYGDCAGAWVDETTMIKPEVDRAKRRANTEQCLQNWADKYAVPWVVLRVPGIYAKDRLPLKRLNSGAPVIVHAEAAWTNRVHADDLAMACYQAMTLPIKNEIINVSDDAPSTMTDYFNAVADYANLPRPPQISLADAQQSLSAGMLSYAVESRRVRNDKMKAYLKFPLKYPNLKDGLK